MKDVCRSDEWWFIHIFSVDSFDFPFLLQLSKTDSSQSWGALTRFKYKPIQFTSFFCCFFCCCEWQVFHKKNVGYFSRLIYSENQKIRTSEFLINIKKYPKLIHILIRISGDRTSTKSRKAELFFLDFITFSSTICAHQKHIFNRFRVVTLLCLCRSGEQWVNFHRPMSIDAGETSESIQWMTSNMFLSFEFFQWRVWLNHLITREITNFIHTRYYYEICRLAFLTVIVFFLCRLHVEKYPLPGKYL